MAYLHDLADTWNDSGTTFTALKMNVTDTASNAASKLLDLQVGGNPRLTLSKTPDIKLYTSSYNANTYLQLGTSNSGTISHNSNSLGRHYALVGDSTGSGGPAILAFGSGGNITWQSTTRQDSGSVDLALYRDAANTLALRNTTAAQALNVYNTYTDASNYERFTAKWSSNIAILATEKAGTGSTRTMEFHIGGTNVAKFNTAGLSPSSSNVYSLGASTLAWANAYIGTGVIFSEASAPTGVADKAILFAQDNGAGKTQLMVIFGSGAAQQVAIEP